MLVGKGVGSFGKGEIGRFWEDYFGFDLGDLGEGVVWGRLKYIVVLGLSREGIRIFISS